MISYDVTIQTPKIFSIIFAHRTCEFGMPPFNVILKDCKVFPQMFAHLTWEIEMLTIDVITKVAITLYC